MGKIKLKFPFRCRSVPASPKSQFLFCCIIRIAIAQCTFPTNKWWCRMNTNAEICTREICLLVIANQQQNSSTNLKTREEPPSAMFKHFSGPQAMFSTLIDWESSFAAKIKKKSNFLNQSKFLRTSAIFPFGGDLFQTLVDYDCYDFYDDD